MSGLYTSAKKLLLDGDLSLLSDTIKCVLIDPSAYTVNLNVHDNLNDVPAGARIGVPQTLTNKSTAGGVFDADNVTFPACTGNTVTAAILYKDTGDEATSSLIAYIDVGGTTPNGLDLLLPWSNGANKIFTL